MPDVSTPDCEEALSDRPVRGRPAWFDLAPEPPRGTDSIDVMPAATDVVVVGLGASGLEAIVALAAGGADVLGVDAIGIAGGAAGGNGGFLLAGLADFHHHAVTRHGRDVVARWTSKTLEELDRLFDTEPTARRVGSLRIAADAAEEDDCHAQVIAMQADGLTAEPWDGPEGRGLLLASDGVFNPVARCRRLAAVARDNGATLVAPARVGAIASGHVTVSDPTAAAAAVGDRVVRCRTVIVAVDGGLDVLLPNLRGRVRTARLQMLATAPETAVSLSRPVYRRHGYDYVQQLPTGEVLLGGGRDVEGHAAWDAVPVPSAAVQDHLDALLRNTIGATAPVTHRWAARAGFTSDSLPIDAEVEPGVHVIGGYSGHGNVIGGLLARRLAAQLLDRPR